MNLLTEAPRPARVARWSGAPWLVIGTVCFGAFLGQLDASIVTLALPAMAAHFGADVSWVSLAYLITLVALVVPVGRWADLVGRKLVYCYGFAVFTIGSLACCVAPSLGVLVAARVVQAVGAAMLQANSVALVVASVPAARMRVALGVQTAAQALGLAVGPLLGGALVSAYGWQAVFAINVPVGIVAMIAGHYLLPRTQDRASPFSFAPLRDGRVLGGLLGVFGSYALLFAPMALLPFTMRAPLTEVGLFVALLPVGFAFAALLLRQKRIVGAVVSTVALLLPSGLGLFALGVGLGIVAPASTGRVMAALPACHRGVGSGLVNMARGLGTAAGVAAASLVIHLVR